MHLSKKLLASFFFADVRSKVKLLYKYVISLSFLLFLLLNKDFRFNSKFKRVVINAIVNSCFAYILLRLLILYLLTFLNLATSYKKSIIYTL